MSADLISKSWRSLHRGDLLPSRPRRDALGPELLAAPGCEHHVRFAPHDLVGIAMMRSAGRVRSGPLGKNVFAAGDLDQLAHPADAADHRLVPFLEIDAGPARQTFRRLAHHRAGPSRDAAPAPRPSPARRRCEASIWIIERISPTERWLKIMTLMPGLGELARDVGLQIGKPEHQVGLQLQDLVDLRADRNAETLGFSCRARGGRTV